MKPTVGRIVHYYHKNSQTVPWAALVTRADQGGVGLTVFGHHNGNLLLDAVPQSDEPKPGHWMWPPREG